MIEKRKEPRHRIVRKTFAIDWCAPHRLGEVLDISRSGMAFSCIEWPNGFQPKSEIGIFSSADDFFLQNVMFQTVSDLEIEGHPASSVIMKRHSGCFLSLSEEQAAKLDAFINQYDAEMI